jgi:hypothetical protein
LLQGYFWGFAALAFAGFSVSAVHVFEITDMGA